MLFLIIIDSFKEIWKDPSLIFNPESLIRYGGLMILFLVVYAQTGLFFCFFLPGGAVMFTAGVLITTGDLPHTLFTVCTTLILASFSGNITSYWIGRKAGPLFYNRSDSAFFRREHLIMADTFYKQYGAIALSAGLFLPIIRTFAPIVAGMIKMNFQRFLLFTFAGSVLWVVSMISAGYLLSKIPFFKAYLGYIVVAIILVVTIPIVIRIIRAFKKMRNEVATRGKKK